MITLRSAPLALLVGVTSTLPAQVLTPLGEPDPAYSGLWAWFDAANGVNASATPLPDGTPLTSWSDRSVNVRDLTRLDTDPSRVPVVADDDASCGTAVRFDGNDYVWASTTDAFGRLVGERTIFVVAEVDVANGSYVFDGSTNSGRTTLHTGQIATPGTWHVFTGDSTQPALNGSLMVGGAVEESRYQVHAIVMQPNLQEHYIDFVLESSGNAPDVFNLGGLVLGARVNLTLGLTGHIKEVLIYEEALSAADRQSIEGYLSVRHAMPSGSNYGAGCAGTGGLVPRLRTIGCPGYGESWSLRLTDANPNSPTVILFGLGEGGFQFGSCTYLLSIYAFQVGGGTDTNGEFVLPFVMPATGTPFVVNAQAFTIDANAPPLGLSMSNGVSLDIY